MASCPEVKTGNVGDPGEDFTWVQALVDQGKNPWRLDPVKTAQIVGTAFGLEPSDRYTLIQTYYDPGSGLHYADVLVEHGPCRYLVELMQPVRQGAGGVWALQSITPLP